MLIRLSILWVFVLFLNSNARAADYSFLNLSRVNWQLFFGNLRSGLDKIYGCEDLYLNFPNNPERPTIELDWLEIPLSDESPTQQRPKIVINLEAVPHVFTVVSNHKINFKGEINRNVTARNWTANLFYIHEPIATTGEDKFQDISHFLTVYLKDDTFEGIRLETTTQSIKISDGVVQTIGKEIKDVWQCGVHPAINTMNAMVQQALKQAKKELKRELKWETEDPFNDLPPNPNES